METIKSYTDLQQSRKLAEILPIESADMYFEPSTGFCTEPSEVRVGDIKYAHPRSVPCWSLTALLSVLEHPRCFQGDKPIYWFCGCFSKDNLYHEVESDNPVDSCYKMILELNKLNLL